MTCPLTCERKWCCCEIRKNLRRKSSSTSPKRAAFSRKMAPTANTTARQPYPTFRVGKVRSECNLPVSQDENRGYEPKYGSRGALEAAIRKLHHNRQLQKTTEPPKEERCRSTDILDKPQKMNHLKGNAPTVVRISLSSSLNHPL
ncbi:hypothetical protein CEXT_237201 [Caerostris extrusa]|uniref:Uncharacterized protein n=1 Tax=Caerostris extrusa TaxID=172846 RepID=A0AAV4U0Y4_CAEEX|nr:hypothetical protein CEXT_237201 [Caerostris extrusa]